MTNEKTDGVSKLVNVEGQSYEGKLAEDLREANPADIAAFIASSLLEMRKLAVTFQMKFLVYLLEMAFKEADIQADNATPKDP